MNYRMPRRCVRCGAPIKYSFIEHGEKILVYECEREIGYNPKTKLESVAEVWKGQMDCYIWAQLHS